MFCIDKSEKRTPFIDLIWDTAMLLCVWCAFNRLSFYTTNGILRWLTYSFEGLSEQLIYAISSMNVSTWSLAIPIVYLKYLLKPLGSVILNNCKCSIRILVTGTFVTVVLFALHALVTWNEVDMTFLYKHFDFMSECTTKARAFKLGFLSEEILASPYSSFAHFFWQGIIVHSLRIAIFEELMFRGIFQYIFFRYTKRQLLSVVVTSLLFSAYHLHIHQSILLFLAGMFFSYIYHITNHNMCAVMWVHFLYNAIVHTMRYSGVIYLYQKIARCCHGFTLLESVVCMLLCMFLMYILLHGLKRYKSRCSLTDGCV